MTIVSHTLRGVVTGVVMIPSGLTSSPMVNSVCCTMVKFSGTVKLLRLIFTIPDSVTETLLRTVLFSPSVMVR